MSEAVPPRAPGQKKSSNKWLIGCAVGCVGFLVIAGLATVAVFMFVVPRIQEGMEQGRQEMAAGLQAEYAKLDEAGKIPEEHKPLFDELMGYVQSDELGIYGVLITGGAVVSFLEDGTLSESELAGAEELRAFLEQNPDAGMMAVTQFLSTHPQLQHAFESAQTQYGDITELQNMDSGETGGSDQGSDASEIPAEEAP